VTLAIIMTVGISNTALSLQLNSEAYAQGEKFNAKLPGDQQYLQ